MSCLKVSVIVLLISIGIGYYYGPQIHLLIPHKSLQTVEKYLPKQVMQWMHRQSTTEKDKLPGDSSDTKESIQKTGKVFTKADLWEHYRGGEGSKGLYIAFFGKVYDVSAGKDHYGPGGGYSFFAGRDGTRGFVTGEFTDEGLTDKLDGLDPSTFLGFEEWAGFYETTYKYVGTVIGNFYDENGTPTAALHEAHKTIELAKDGKKKMDDEKKMFPPCNSEHSAAKGSRVWCSNRSGGIERDWVGVPRLYHSPGAKESRCACINSADLTNPSLKEYVNCPPKAQSCVTNPPK